MTSVAIMPRITAVCAVAVVGACAFDASYGSGKYKCSDGVCPSNLVCTAGMCVKPGSGADGPMPDAPIPDGPRAVLTCGTPGMIGSAGGTFMDTTAGRTNSITASCNGGVMNGPDAVYSFDAITGDHLAITLDASFSTASAYVILTCTEKPGTPICAGNAGTSGSATWNYTATVTGTHYLVVDATIPTSAGPYTLTVSR